MRIGASVLACAGMMAVACGGGSGGGGGNTSLDCAWLSGDNCWKTTASKAISCLPPSTESGKLSADNSTCTYASGAVVTFASPLTLPTSGQPTWNFTITVGGQTCVRFDNKSSGFNLTVGNETVTEGASGTLGVKVTCPGGATYSNPNAFDLFSCGVDGGDSLGGIPGDAWSSTDTSVNFGLLSTSTTSFSELVLFDCKK